ncbi:MAG: hypothetical protein K6E59_06925 [Bacilli bacterium]|nr:hypothetical protein [Bacilli bacterium]
MIKLAKPKFDSHGVLVIRDDEIESFAYRQLRDYQKDYFKEPHPLDIDDFVENYLGIKVSYHTLTRDGSKLGATALVDGFLPIIDDDGEISARFVKKGEIVIDLQAYGGFETCIRFSLSHEAWHSQFDLSVDTNGLDIMNAVSYTYAGPLDEPRQYKGRTPREWMEHHANRYAVYILMPKTFVKRLWKKYHAAILGGKRITKNSPDRLWRVIRSIATQLKVSLSSIALRLKELKIISKEVFDSLELKK